MAAIKATTSSTRSRPHPSRKKVTGTNTQKNYTRLPVKLVVEAYHNYCVDVHLRFVYGSTTRSTEAEGFHRNNLFLFCDSRLKVADEPCVVYTGVYAVTILNFYNQVYGFESSDRWSTADSNNSIYI